ncbi:Uncharacterized protein TCM_043123 [Theobroma cacao]|uniref:Uncharacterized protein n=1 Tax=Theobroma cacao TaxID=3641 RepID=A0A061FP12_THECC|nr:Uncharacterized protein TCM_043123 [Theobroma cacao]
MHTIFIYLYHAPCICLWHHHGIRVYMCLAPCMPFAEPTEHRWSPWMAYEEPCIYSMYIYLSMNIFLLQGFSLFFLFLWFHRLKGYQCNFLSKDAAGF